MALRALRMIDWERIDAERKLVDATPVVDDHAAIAKRLKELLAENKPADSKSWCREREHDCDWPSCACSNAVWSGRLPSSDRRY